MGNRHHYGRNNLAVGPQMFYPVVISMCPGVDITQKFRTMGQNISSDALEEEPFRVAQDLLRISPSKVLDGCDKTLVRSNGPSASRAGCVEIALNVLSQLRRHRQGRCVILGCPYGNGTWGRSPRFLSILPSSLHFPICVLVIVDHIVFSFAG
jgi:hypothetical protein